MNPPPAADVTSPEGTGSGKADAPRRGPARVRYLLLVLLLQAVFLGVVYLLAWKSAPPPRVLVEDVLTLPGSSAELAAWCEQDVPPLLASLRRGRQVRFVPQAGGEELTAVTDRDGWARVASEFSATGVLRYSVVADGIDRPVPTIVAALPAGQPLALVLVRHVLAILPPVTFYEDSALFADAAGQVPRARAGSQAAIEWLVERGVQPVYVDFDARREGHQHREWLDQNSFPPGPILFVPGYDPAFPQDRAEWLRELVDSKIRSHWRVRWAFTWMASDAGALEKEGTTVIVVGQSTPPKGLAPTTRALGNWQSVLELLKTEG